MRGADAARRHIPIAVGNRAAAEHVRHQPAGWVGPDNVAGRIAVREFAARAEQGNEAAGVAAADRRGGECVGELAAQFSCQPARVTTGSTRNLTCHKDVGCHANRVDVTDQAAVFTLGAGDGCGGIGVVDQSLVGSDQRTKIGRTRSRHRAADKSDIADRTGYKAEQPRIRGGGGVGEVADRVAQTVEDAGERRAGSADGRPARGGRPVERGGEREFASKAAVDVLHIGHAVEQRVGRAVDGQRATIIGAAIVDAVADTETQLPQRLAGKRRGVVCRRQPQMARTGNRDGRIDRDRAGRTEQQPVGAGKR